eukprot:TRINITY_DN5031_c1_g1_i3.p1 TRINITY_DN5031_c1_g1~~TRINITY_DN5031_c1_g1_i3.p1  ORF type:complete len:900 (+),score=311.38 TRINITY_DN5031_c1_g1_i3:305-2701(+)
MLGAFCEKGCGVCFVFKLFDGNIGWYRVSGRRNPIKAELRVVPFPWTCLTVQRVSRLKIGEGKAENQIHALPFARGDVLQAVDMNQYATSDQGTKIPFMLNDFFSVPDATALDKITDDNKWDHNILIPPFRIVGFPENCYTRDLSMVGELMGAAEWCFVTINQRVLSWPLRTRAHYGHPDFFDGFWARTRGGTSKASLKVNTNEDIFAGYEMLGRGERGSYVEFLEMHKGRETAFPNAYGFEAKLAQGAAQQIRSIDVYSLNRKLDLFSRFSLFYGTLAFYLTNFVMAISINYYILSIVLFAMSGISYHQLGLMDAIIAIPWLLQVGYILAIPMIVELVLQKGFLRGLVEFVLTLPIAVFFFVFHMRTKTYYFGKGLLVGSGGYVATGRGFGLARQSMKEMYQTYSESHFIEGFLIFICLVIYAAYGSDPVVPYLARTFTIILIAMSWLWAPVVFNPMPTTQELQTDLSAMMDWIGTTVRNCRQKEASKMKTDLETVHTATRVMLAARIAKDKETTTAESAVRNTGDDAASTSDQSDNESTTGQEINTGKKNTLEQWYGELVINDSASFHWKPGMPKKPQVPEPEVRAREVIAEGLKVKDLVSTVRGAGHKIKEKLEEFGVDTVNVETFDIKGVVVLRLKATKGDEEKEVDKLFKDKSSLMLELDEVTVKIQKFAQWSANRIPTFNGYDEMVAQYWTTEDGKRNAADESWKAWYMQKVVFDLWQSEDEHSKTAVQYLVATVIKVYLHAEFYLPWMLIAFAYWNMESLWLVIVSIFLVSASHHMFLHCLQESFSLGMLN